MNLFRTVWKIAPLVLEVIEKEYIFQVEIPEYGKFIPEFGI